MDKIPVAVVFLGPPASGKGTAANFLLEKYNIPSISPGNIFKKIRYENSELSELVISHTANGGLCPDWITNKIVLEEARKLIENGASSITLDGYPRTLEQLNFLLENYDIKLFVQTSTNYMTLKKLVVNRRNCKTCKKVFSALSPIENCCSNCDISNSENWETRWDDNDEMFSKRYKVFKTETFPIINKIKNNNNYLKIDLIKDDLAIDKIISKIKPAF